MWAHKPMRKMLQSRATFTVIVLFTHANTLHSCDNCSGLMLLYANCGPCRTGSLQVHV